MRKSKKVISVMMAMTMAAVMAVPAQMSGVMPGTKTVYAADDKQAEQNAQGKCGDNAVYKYDGKTQTLTVSGTGEMWDDYGFARNLTETKKIVIEKGITAIGSYSFQNLENVKEVSIAESVTTIKKEAFEYIEGTVEIPKSVTKVETNAFTGAKKYIIKGDVTGYEVLAFGGYYSVEEIVLYGTAQDLGKALYDSSETIITIAQENTKCKVGSGCLLSADGKQLYYCLNQREEITVPDTVEKIWTGAFQYRYLNSITLGKNVTTIDDFAFVGVRVKKISFNEKLTSIGTKAFYGAKFKNVTLKGKVKLGVGAFNDKVKIKYTKKFKRAQTTIAKAQVSKSKYNIRFAKIADAKGYQIRIKKGKKTYKYTTTKNYYTKKAPKALTKDYKVTKDYSIYDIGTKPDGAAYVTVRPYKKVKNKTYYGRWSAKTVLSYK